MYNQLSMSRNQQKYPENSLVQEQPSPKKITSISHIASPPKLKSYYTIQYEQSKGNNKTAIVILLLLCYFIVVYQSFAIKESEHEYLEWLQQINKLEQFGKKQKFKIKIRTLPNTDVQITPYLKMSMKKMGLDEKIQVASNFDYEITKFIDFHKLQQDLDADINNLVFTFKRNQSLEIPPPLITNKNFKKNKDIEDYLQKLTNGQYQESIRWDLQYNLAINLARAPQNEQLKQAEYYLADKKYKIGSESRQLPFCIFTMQRNIVTKLQNKQYFDSLERLNYTNFRVVYIDDFSTDSSPEYVYSFFKNKNSRLKNRITIIKNSQKLGALANMFFYIKKYCYEEDIVVIFDGDDALVGSQVLKILNSVYQNSSIWYAYSNYLTMMPENSYIFKGKQSKPLNYTSMEYRQSFKWITSHIRTFRKKLVNSVPIYSLIQYHFSRQQLEAWPKFYLFAPDLAMTFALIQLAGNSRITYIKDYLYHYYGPASNDYNCYREHQVYDDIKIRLKIPLQRLEKLNDEAKMSENYVFQNRKLIQLRKAYYNYENCMRQFFMKTKQIGGK